MTENDGDFVTRWCWDESEVEVNGLSTSRRTEEARETSRTVAKVCKVPSAGKTSTSVDKEWCPKYVTDALGFLYYYYVRRVLVRGYVSFLNLTT